MLDEETEYGLTPGNYPSVTAGYDPALDSKTPHSSEHHHQRAQAASSAAINASREQARMEAQAGINDSADMDSGGDDIKQLTKQIVALQELVLTYQNKYLDLKRQTNTMKRRGNRGAAAIHPPPPPPPDDDDDDDDGSEEPPPPLVVPSVRQRRNTPAVLKSSQQRTLVRQESYEYDDSPDEDEDDDDDDDVDSPPYPGTPPPPLDYEQSDRRSTLQRAGSDAVFGLARKNPSVDITAERQLPRRGLDRQKSVPASISAQSDMKVPSDVPPPPAQLPSEFYDEEPVMPPPPPDGSLRTMPGGSMSDNEDGHAQEATPPPPPPNADEERRKRLAAMADALNVIAPDGSLRGLQVGRDPADKLDSSFYDDDQVDKDVSGIDSDDEAYDAHRRRRRRSEAPDGVEYVMDPKTRTITMVASQNQPKVTEMLSPKAQAEAFKIKQHLQHSDRRKMLELLDVSPDSKLGLDVDGRRKTGLGWINTKKYTTIVIELTETIELAAKLGKSFFLVMRVDGQAFKTKRVKTSKLSQWTDTFIFPLRDTTQNITVTVYDNDEDGYIGRSVIRMEKVAQPADDIWAKLQTVRETLYIDKRSRARNPSELHLRIKMSSKPCPPAPSHHTSLLEEKATSIIGDALRSKVSKNNMRLQEDGFDLDLSYISERIIAMGQPSTSLAGVYRNRMKDVQRLLEQRHSDRYKVYNLCSELSYSASKFGGRLVHVPIGDHEPCQYPQILPFCQDVHSWLTAHPQNLVAIHCKSGKGRTGMMVACYLLYAKKCRTAKEAIEVFSAKRTRDGRAVTLPSQIRYVEMFERYLSGCPIPEWQLPTNLPPSVLTRIKKNAQAQVSSFVPNSLSLVSIRITSVPNGVNDSASNFYFKMTRLGDSGFKFSSKKAVRPIRYSDGVDSVVFSLPADRKVLLNEDVRCQFFATGALTKKELFSFFFSTRFVFPDHKDPKNVTLHLRRCDIDGPQKDKRFKTFPQDFAVTLTLRNFREVYSTSRRDLAQALVGTHL
jgi:phosphatidylinositol-3,4,5-trisphosphate 3-phosphatase and dual-specificity protein phosphatase PTEN